MTFQEAVHRSREIKLEKARLIRDQAARHYQRNRKLHSSMPGAISEEEFEDSKTVLDLCELDVELCEIKLQVGETEEPP